MASDWTPGRQLVGAISMLVWKRSIIGTHAVAVVLRHLPACCLQEEFDRAAAVLDRQPSSDRCPHMCHLLMTSAC